MRIIHVRDCAGIAGTLAATQRVLGHDAITLEDNRRESTASYQFRVLKKVKDFKPDIFHVHAGFWPSHWVWPILKLIRKTPIVLHLHGSETRSGRGLHHLGAAALILCATPDLRPLVRGAIWIPNPVPVPADVPARADWGKSIIGHFPSDRASKGTEDIIRAFRSSGLGRDAEMWIIENVPHEKVLRIMQECDIVIDQVNDIGAYGVVAVEALGLGKIVLSSIRPELYPAVVPIVPVTRETLADRLRYWVQADEDDRARLGREGRAYAMSTHDPVRITKRVLWAYEDALDGA